MKRDGLQEAVGVVCSTHYCTKNFCLGFSLKEDAFSSSLTEFSATVILDHLCTESNLKT